MNPSKWSFTDNQHISLFLCLFCSQLSHLKVKVLLWAEQENEQWVFLLMHGLHQGHPKQVKTPDPRDLKWCLQTPSAVLLQFILASVRHQRGSSETDGRTERGTLACQSAKLFSHIILCVCVCVFRYSDGVMRSPPNDSRATTMSGWHAAACPRSARIDVGIAWWLQLFAFSA